MSDQWFYSDNAGSQAGPVSQDALNAKITSDEVAKSALVWQEGMPDWVPATSIPALQVSATPQPQITSGNAPAATSDNLYASPQADLAIGSHTVTNTSLKHTLFSFQGRISRSTYWGYSILSSVVIMIPVIIVAALITPILAEKDEAIAAIAMGLIMLIAFIPIIWISLALQIKRWHDRAKSGWWICINFIPYVGAIWAFVENGCLRGTVGPNQYGNDPT